LSTLFQKIGDFSSIAKKLQKKCNKLQKITFNVIELSMIQSALSQFITKLRFFENHAHIRR
jgi:hypothetical protein